MVSGNIVLGWLQACSEPHRRRLAQRLGLAGSQMDERPSLDGLAAALLAECAGDLKMKPGDLARVVGNPREVGREAVMELALAGLGSPVAA
ncbi:MAG: hypothetical protein CMJ40_06930 [Phycisphaerae bacterium]|nr:hypothetical protein [Phycisphaerae bacterium]